MSNNNNKETRRPRIVEDAPTYRSVPMMPAMMAPSMPLRTAPLAPMKHAVQQWDPQMQTYVERKPLAETTTPWEVSKALAMPSYYQLERAHVTVPDATPTEVSERIAKCLCQESIAATFDNKQCIARAETSNNLKFAVRLWDVQNEVVVEVQRTSGCCFLYQQAAKAILRAASVSSSSSAPATLTKKSLPMPRCVPQIPESAWQECTADDLDNATTSFKQANRLDAHMLAAESLVQLSEASKCRVFCAKKILSADNNSGLLSTLLSLVQCSRMNNDDEEEEEEVYSVMDETHFGLMHRHALTVLANCLSAVRESGELQYLLADLPELTSDSMVQALVQDLSLARDKPHEATAACRCLQALCCCSDDCKAKVVDLGAKPLVNAAQHQCRHALLEAEASKLMQDL